MEIPSFPKRTRETQIRRDRMGQWWNGEDLIDHPNVSRSFDAWIHRADDNRFCLKNDINWAYVQIEGPPYRVISVSLSTSEITLRLTGDIDEVLDPKSLVRDRDDVMWCTVRERVPAVFESHASTQLGTLFDEDTKGPYLLLSGIRYHPPLVMDPLQLGVASSTSELDKSE